MSALMRQLLPSHLFPNQHRSVTSSIVMSSSTKRKLIDVMPVLTAKLRKLKEQLVIEVKKMCEETSSSEVETLLDNVREMKNAFQDEVEDFVEVYEDLVENSEALDEWKLEVRSIARELRKHTDVIRFRALQDSLLAKERK